jgi:hypothetical protein
MLQELLEFGGRQLIAPIALAVIATWFVRTLFSVHRTKSQHRRDFLELWPTVQAPDDLWIEVAIRHLYGEHLPAAVIRSLQRASQPALALRQISSAWALLAMDDETNEIRWRSRSHQSSGSRAWMTLGLALLYWVLMIVAVALAIVLLNIELMGVMHTFWGVPIMLGGFGMQALIESETLAEADKAVPRWLGVR